MCTMKVETKNNVLRIFFFSFLKHGNPDLKSYTLEAWNHLPRITNRVPLKLEFKGRATHTIWPGKEQTTWMFSALIFFINDLWSMCTKPNPFHEIVLAKLTEGSITCDREPRTYLQSQVQYLSGFWAGCMWTWEIRYFSSYTVEFSSKGNIYLPKHYLHLTWSYLKTILNCHIHYIWKKASS